MDHPIHRLRAICLALPGVTEKVSHGEPTWFAGRVFVQSSDHHHDDRVGFWCAADRDERDALVADRPESFYVPPYVGGRGWLGMYLDGCDGVVVDWDEVTDIVDDAYRLIAPKRLVAELDAQDSSG